MKHFKYHSIEQFRNVIRTVKDRCNYHGEPLPTLTFSGTIKLHGTNAGVVLDLTTSEVYAQSREQLIAVGSDNAGFAAFVAEHGEFFKTLLKSVYEQALAEEFIRDEHSHVAIYGEWAGPGIMKGTAISQLKEKHLFIFGAKVIKNGDPEDRLWLTPTTVGQAYDTKRRIGIVPSQVKWIYDYKNYSISIDFAHPELSQNELVQLTSLVEQECPVGKDFGISGIGEGIVWSANNGVNPVGYADLIFKVKGEKHSDTKVKTIAEVDVEKIAKVNDFVAACCTDHRLEKMLAKLEETGVPLDVKSTGTFLKLVANDILKEESDRIEASGLEWKALAGQIANTARQWWLKRVTGA